jgi:hypothetical protein
MSGRVRGHIRSNIVGYIALFFALSTSSAVALRGSNTVFTDDIVDGAVKTQDISDTNGVWSADVRDDTLENGGLTAADLRPDSVGTSEVTAGAVGTDEVASDSLLAGDLATSSVGEAEIASSAVGSGEVIDGSLGTSELSRAIPAARVTNSADEVTRDHIGESLPFDSERYDTAGMHTTTNNSRLTAPVKGIYAVSASVTWSSDPDGSRFVGLKKNGDTFVAAQTQPAIAGNATDQELSHQVLLQEGDYVEVRVHKVSGNPLAVLKFQEASPEFAMTWLAPGP